MVATPAVIAEMKEHFVRKFKFETHLPKDEFSIAFVSSILEDDPKDSTMVLETTLYYNIIDDTVSVRETEVRRISKY